MNTKSETAPVPRAAPKPVNLGAFAMADTADLEVMLPGGETSTGWVITFAGPNHPQTIAWATEQARRALRKQQAIEAAQVNGRKFKGEDRDPEEVRRENVEWVVARITGWGPFNLNPADPPIPFSREAAIDLFLRRDLGWIYAQALDFLAGEQSFMPGSAKT